MQLPKNSVIIEIERILGSEKFSVNHLRSGIIYNVRLQLKNSGSYSLEKLFWSE